MPDIRPLPEELQKIAITELGEVPERIAEDLHVLKAWIRQQPHLKACIEDLFLIQFLRGSKYSLEKAKEKLSNFYTLSAKSPHLRSMADVDDPTFRRVHRTGCLTLLPTPLMEHGPRIIVEQVTFGPNEFTSDEISRYVWTIAEIVMQSDPYACIQGLVIVMDFSKVTLQHLHLLSPKMLLEVMMFSEKALPLRIKRVLVLNCPTFVQTLLNFALSCCSEKFQKRIHVSDGKNIDKFADVFPKKYLPQDFGGENSSVADICREFEKVIDEYRNYFKRNSECGIDERLRLEESNFNKNTEFGAGGSFRKINVD
ncbi:retinol-binding protein pinta-like [Musca domestica]|uniref:Retinol-binding protein pinta-like n=1 Tax=Musca domestica TaxID=7370 RepID=A0A1I8N7J1_MUSDO|nr:retinol-binding protein pinta-like [Musca domestica]